jgi:hypothetical protein
VMGTILTNEFPRRLPPALLQAVGPDAARLSVAEVIRRVHALSPAIQDSSLSFVRLDFADAVHTGFRVSAVIVLVVTAITFWWYPGSHERAGATPA